MSVQYRALGTSGLKVSPLALGTMNFGASDGVSICDSAEAARMIDMFVDAGHNLIDTADKYNGGQSEEIVGAAVKSRRSSLVIATKGGQPQGTGPNDRGLSRAHLTRALEASLRRLQTDYIDLYQCHLPDPTTPIEETMATLDGFVRSGKVRYLGCANFTAAQIIAAQWAAERAGHTAFVSLQGQYSLVARQLESEIVPACSRYGLGVLAWSPLGVGILAGRYQRGQPAPDDSRLGRVTARSPRLGAHWATTLLTERKFDIAEGAADIAAELSTTPAVVAISWLANRPGVSSVILGPRTAEQLAENLIGFDLSSDTMRRLDALSRPAIEP